MLGAQKQLIREQDDHLDEIAEIAERIKVAAGNINIEINNQEK